MMKLAIIGASYLQEPLIRKAKKRVIETHVFAWAANDVGEKSADYFYPISIVEKEQILERCRKIGIDGICSIASDLAAVTVNYVADRMGLIGNTMSCVEVSTNKFKMRECFKENGDPSPDFIKVENTEELKNIELRYPVIVKPVDRSGSRGVRKLETSDGLEQAIERAKKEGFAPYVILEEYVEGKEYSVEFISWRGKHHFLSLTQKYTTGTPNFIETGHLEPALLETKVEEKVKQVVMHALDSLQIEYGASHAEIKITEEGDINLIEIGGRMGGDFIGSDLVELSTGFDFVNAVIDIALGKEPVIAWEKRGYAAVRFILSEEDVDCLEKMKREHMDMLVREEIERIDKTEVLDSSERFGYFLFTSDQRDVIEGYLPDDGED